MGRTWKPPPYGFPRAAVIGFALVLTAPVLWIGLPLTHVLQTTGPPTATGDGTSTTYWGNSEPTISAAAVYDPAGNTVVAAFTSQGPGSPGSIMFLWGTNLTNRSWLYPECNPGAIADEPGTGYVLVLCQLASRNWELVPVNTLWKEALPPVLLPSGDAYANQLVYDGRSNMVYVLREPSNLSDPAQLLGIQAATGAVSTNLTVSSIEDPYEQTMALGPTPGTVFWLDDKTGTVELLNTTTGTVLQASSSGVAPDGAIYYDPVTADLFVPTYDGENTTILSTRNLSVVGELADSTVSGVVSDPAHQETYLYGIGGGIMVVRTSDWSLVGWVQLPFSPDQIVYDPVTDQFAGIQGSEGSPAVEVISISRAPVIGPAFSSLPVAGSNFPVWLAGTTFLLGAALLIASRRAISAALKRRRIERDRQFAEWMAEPWVDKWTGDSRAHSKER